MKKYFICSDVHSYYDEWMSSLKKHKFDIDNPEHIIINCGDLFDRGNKPVQVLNFVDSLLKQDRIICIRGNHDQMLYEVLRRKKFEVFDINNGTSNTIYEISGIYPSKNLSELSQIVYCAIDECNHNEKLINYLNSLIDYYETDKYVFVHAWIPYKRNEKNYNQLIYDEDWRNKSFHEAMWVNPFVVWSHGIRVPNKTVVCGHWYTYEQNYLYNFEKYKKTLSRKFLDSYVVGYKTSNSKEEDKIMTELFKPFICEGIIALDGCTPYSHIVNCVTIDENEL